MLIKPGKGISFRDDMRYSSLRREIKGIQEALSIKNKIK